MKQQKHKELDSQLVQKFREGRPEGLSFLYETFFATLCLFLEKMHIEEHGVEEIVQDAFLKLWEKRENFENIAAIRSFLYTCCRNAALNSIDKDSRQKRHREDFVRQADVADWPITDQIVYMESIREIHKAISTLPNQCRAIMSMLVMDELSPQEVADKLGIAKSTVYNQKKRGIELLQAVLKKEQFYTLLLILHIMAK